MPREVAFQKRLVTPHPIPRHGFHTGIQGDKFIEKSERAPVWE